MIKSDKIEKMYVFNLGGKEYHIIGRLVAYYLAKLKLSVCMKDIPYSGFINFHNEFIKVHKCLYYTK